MFKKIAVIGVGLMGGSFCRAVKKSNAKVHVTALDLPEVLEKARQVQFIDSARELGDLEDVCQQADLVVIATPISGVLELLPRIAEFTASEAIVTDVGSLKTEINQVGAKYFTGPNGHFIGGHPMAGGENPGLESSDPFLFQNALYALSPASGVPFHKLEKMAKLVESIGAHGVIVEPETHDQIAATVSHLPQLLAVTLMRYVAAKNVSNELYLKMAAGGFRDMTRIASSPFGIWRDICDGNRENIAEEINGLIQALQETREQLVSGDLKFAFQDSARSRLSIPSDTRGFLRPQYDLVVEVEDKPGVIATISVALAEAEINVKDIEVLKVRENEGGTIRLAFESSRVRDQAQKLLSQIGFRYR